jgi:hypothetical protein
MYRLPFYRVEEFWLGIAVGFALVAMAIALFFVRAWALRRIRISLAKRVSTNFTVAGEIFRLLRLPEGSETHLTAEDLSRLSAGIESHSNFFADLLQDEQSFCLFFGKVFAWAFDDIRQIYKEFATGCEQLKHYLTVLQADEAALPPEMDMYLRFITSGSDLRTDITYFRLSRAVAVIDTACRPVLDEYAAKRRAKVHESKFDPLGAVLAKPA